MNYVLSFRKPKVHVHKSISQILIENPGIKWKNYIPLAEHAIQYLEIGCHKGEHVSQIAKSYCIHPDSKIYCIDPWEDYDEYPEYKGAQDTIYNTFLKNIDSCKNKCTIIRGYSHEEIPKFEDNTFDIIYVDGNHETEYVYKDAKLALKTVKIGGYIVFDDYIKDWWESVVKGVDMFLDECKDNIEIIAKPTDCLERFGHCPQVIVKRIS